MNDENKKKREWVKTAAIVFLTIMLILTFFSNTILNYSLPEVATQRIQSGTITAKVRGTGTVESGDPYNVEVKQSRKVASVAVKAGDKVEKGDILLYLEDQESEELNEAIKQLETLQNAFDKAILTGVIDKAMANKVQNGNTASVNEYMNRIEAAKAEMEKAQKEVDEAQKWVNALNSQISLSSAVAVNTSAEEKALNEAQLNLDNATLSLENAKLTLTNAEIAWSAVSSGNAGAEAMKKVEEAQRAVDSWTQTVNNYQKTVNEKQAALNQAKLKADNAQTESSSTVNNLKKQLTTAEYNLSVLNETLTARKTAYEDLLSVISAELDLSAQIDAINSQKEVVEKLREESVAATVTADVAGTVTSISVTAGGSTAPGTPVMVIQPEGKGFTLSFSVTNEQAKKFAVGDAAELVNSWWYSDITAKVASIKPDTTDPAKKKLVTFDLSGELTAGQTLSLSVGQKSSNYDMIVPNSAIREDNNGKFILIIESKSSPLGTRYFATRVDVEILASDDTQSAISGGLYGYEDVITTSTKPIEAGKQVRLPD